METKKGYQEISSEHDKEKILKIYKEEFLQTQNGVSQKEKSILFKSLPQRINF